jgi:hypothetical protein
LLNGVQGAENESQFTHEVPILMNQFTHEV